MLPALSIISVSLSDELTFRLSINRMSNCFIFFFWILARSSSVISLLIGTSTSFVVGVDDVARRDLTDHVGLFYRNLRYVRQLHLFYDRLGDLLVLLDQNLVRLRINYVDGAFWPTRSDKRRLLVDLLLLQDDRFPVVKVVEDLLFRGSRVLAGAR